MPKSLSAVQLEVFASLMSAASTEERRRLYRNASEMTKGFTNIPKGCEEAIQIIKKLGEATEVTTTLRRSSALEEEVRKHPEKGTSQISSLALSVISGNPPEVTSAQSAASAVLAASSLKPQLENPEKPNPQSTAIAYLALTSLLLDPKAARKIEQWKSEGINLYTKVIQELGLNKESFVDIEDIQRADCSNPEIILAPLCKKPKNDLNILRNNTDLKDLLDDFTKLANNEEPIAAIITRPPQTFGIFYNPQNKTFLFFDLEAQKGLQLQLFRSTDSLVKHLMERKPIDDRFAKSPEFYNTQSGQYQNPNACEIRIFRKRTDSGEELNKGENVQHEPSEKTTTFRTESNSPTSSSAAAAASGPPRRDLMEKAEDSSRRLYSSSSSSATAAAADKASIALAKRLTKENEDASIALARSLLAEMAKEADNEASVALAERLGDEASVALAKRLMEEEEE